MLGISWYFMVFQWEIVAPRRAGYVRCTPVTDAGAPTGPLLTWMLFLRLRVRNDKSFIMSNPPLNIPADKLPRHVAMIMDGNGRWALSRRLPRLAGHKAGTENLRRVIRATVEFGVKYLTIYAFSTENWGRPVEEVKGLMYILEDVIDRELKELHEEGVQLRHIGRLERLPPTLQKKVLHAIEITKNNDRLILNVAFNYGGRDEIVNAIQNIIKDGIPIEEVTDQLVSR